MDYFLIFIVLYILIILYLLYKIIKHSFSFNKTEKANDEIITKIVNSFITEVYNSLMLSETRALYFSNLFKLTNERYMMYVAATNMINDFKIIPLTIFENEKNYSLNMKKMHKFYNEFVNTITEYVNNNEDKYIEKGIVSNNLQEVIRKCVEVNYINQYHLSNPVFYHHFFNTIIYYFRTF